MYGLKKVADFFLYTNVFVSICVVALSQSTAIICGIENSGMLLFVFFSTLFSYNFQRLIRFNNHTNSSRQLIWIQNNKNFVRSLTFFALFFSIIYGLKLSFNSLIFLLLPFCFSIFYPFKIKLFNTIFTIREIPYLKLFLISITWSMVTVGLVVIEGQLAITNDIILLFLSRLFFVLAITIPFDIRDLSFDSLSMKTIPQIFGVKKSIYLSLSFLVIFEILSILSFVISDFHFSLLVALLLSSLYAGILITKCHRQSHEYFFGYLMESSSLLMYILLFIIPKAFNILAT